MSPSGRATAGLEFIGHIFVVVVCATVWLPWSVNVSGLNLRLSQMAFPFVLLALCNRPPTLVVTRRGVLLTVCAALFVGGVALWTALAPSGDMHAFGRVGLYILNVIQMGIGYMLVVRTRRLTPFLRTFVFSVAGFNVFFLLLAVGVAADLLPAMGMVERAVQPSLVDGKVAYVMAWRIELGGVLAGCFSAGALAAVLALGRRRFAASAFLAAAVGLSLCAGIIVGFSRQAVLSLAAAVLIILGSLIVAGRLTALFRVVGGLGLLVAGSVVVALVLPGLRGYLDAFAGRTAQLVDQQSYSVGTARDRTEMWGMMLHDIAANPLKGRGQDAYMRYYPSGTGGGSHNLFIEVLHAGGLLAFLPLVLLHLLGIVSAVGTMFRVRNSPEELATVVAVLSCAVATILAATTNLIYWSAPYWLVLGWLLAVGPLHGRGAVRAPIPETVLPPARVGLAAAPGR